VSESKAHVDARIAFTAKYGQCAIEAGLVGKLADHECRHGNLPSDPTVTCRCFRPKKAKR
jgi:hypothetical protein